MEDVKCSSAQRRAQTGANVEQHEHQPIDLCVGFQAEVAADKECHEVNLGADAGATKRGAQQRNRISPTTFKQGDPEHGEDEEKHRDVGSPETIKTPTAYDTADDDRNPGCAKRSGRKLQRNPAIGKQRDDVNDRSIN